MTRFIHTADSQLGMTRHFLEGDAQARFTQDRFDAIVRIGEVAREREAGFVIVCGDVFESNRLDRRTVVRALDAMGSIPVPVYLLPGNHDPLDAASIYDTATFHDHCPAHVHVIRDGEPIEVEPGVVLIGAPWRSKRPLDDLVASSLEDVGKDDTIRIAVGHGAVDELNPNRDDPASISVKNLERLLDDGAIHYVALGDRHAVTEVRPRVWYSGAHVATDYRDFSETMPNHVLVVDVDADNCRVERVPVGAWHFMQQEYRVDTSEDLDAIEADLEGILDKPRTVLRSSFDGVLDMALSARLERISERARDLLAAYTVWESRTNLVVKPSDADLERMELRGFAKAGFERLIDISGTEGDRQQAAIDGLSLVYRLSEVDAR
jgi:DNA repair exonuclease SbcCD nuclease subunit